MSSRQYRRRGTSAAPARRPWPIFLALAGFIVLLVAAYLAWFRPETNAPVEVEVSGAPRLEVDRERVDLGDVRLGQTVSVEFQVANVGDQTLVLEEDPYVEVVEGC
jgi:hypothetical protein